MQLIQRRSNDLTNGSLFDQLFGLRNELDRLVEMPLSDLGR